MSTVPKESAEKTFSGGSFFMGILGEFINIKRLRKTKNENKGGEKLKSAGLAAVLSFLIAGLGQIYNGQIGKGIGMMIAYFISAALMIVIIGFITTPILWIWGMVDAYKQAEKYNREHGFTK